MSRPNSPGPFTIHTDSQTRRLYATDASSYEELPAGVTFPQSTQDIIDCVHWARKHHQSITARGAGTSLAGQTTTNGIVMDLGRHMSRILDINPSQRFAHIQPGLIRDTLNREALKYDLLFGPDTATTNRCMLGGMIGNNSCGIFSIKHKTTREHILEIEAILSDGSLAVFKPLAKDELKTKLELDSMEGHIYREMISLIENHKDKILQNYPHPEIMRRNTGYALDRICEMQPFNDGGRPFNLAELLCGSEGTLAMTASAKLNLVEKEPEQIVLAPHFDTIRTAMEATVDIVEMKPAAVELVDDTILEATKENIEQRKNRFFLTGDPKCILIIQFEGDDAHHLMSKAQKLRRKLLAKYQAAAVPILTEAEEMERAWNLRKAGLGLLMGLGSEERTPSFCEDTAVRVADLPDYTTDFRALLDRHDTGCVFYGHASVGELHLRPAINLQEPDGINKMKAMAGKIAELVGRYGGSLSGEHGDGRARAPYIEKVLGPEMMPILKKVKQIWDPDNIFNPGKIVNPEPPDHALRYSPAYQVPKVDTHFNWRKEEGFANAVELCNGAGVCRKLAESGGTMCPSYMATKEEKDSTRGRANLFRQLFSRKQKDAFESEELRDALDLCLSCKACKSECPANVDMARMKAEFMQGWHEKEGISLGERFFAQAAQLYPLASKISSISNWMLRQPAVKELLYQLAGISKKRALPEFSGETFMKWYHNYAQNSQTRKSSEQLHSFGQTGLAAKAGTVESVVLFIDIFTNYHEPEIGKAAIKFLKTQGYNIIIPEFHELGRPQLSKGMLTHAKKVLDSNLPQLAAYARQGYPIVGLEPSEILTLRDEYVDLCDDNQLEAAQKVAENSFTFEEFARQIRTEYQGLDTPSPLPKVYIHGHCHAKALIGDSAVEETLRRAGYETERIDAGCCGMAGSFGYEASHHKVSMDIGEQRLFPALRALPDEALICAPGFSCRHQIKDGTSKRAYHPAELVKMSLP